MPDASSPEIFRFALILGALVVMPVMVYHRLRAATGEKLDRRQEGLFILLTLRPVGLAVMAGLIAYMVNPRLMAWSSLALPAGVRWLGISLGAVGGALLVWTLPNLGPNLTDTVVTRRSHTLVTTGPYRWVRHPFYVAVTLLMLANGLAAANWFILLAGGLIAVLFAIRTGREEERLLLRFGDSYRRYLRETGRFLPRRAPK